MIIHCAVLPCVPASGCSALSSEGTCRARCRSSSDASVPAPAAACTSRWSRPARPGHWGEPQGEENIKWIESLEEKKRKFSVHFTFFFFDDFPEALDSVLMYPLVWVLVVHQLQCVLQGDDRPGPQQAVTSLLVVTSALSQPSEIYELTGGIETMNSTYFMYNRKSSLKSEFKQVKCLGFRLIWLENLRRKNLFGFQSTKRLEDVTALDLRRLCSSLTWL